MLKDAGGDALLTKISEQTNKSMAITLAPGVFEMIEEGSPITINNIVLRRRRPPRARKDEASPEAEAVAEAAITAKVAIEAEVAQAVGQRQ